MYITENFQTESSSMMRKLWPKLRKLSGSGKGLQADQSTDQKVHLIGRCYYHDPFGTLRAHFTMSVQEYSKLHKMAYILLKDCTGWRGGEAKRREKTMARMAID